MTHTTPKGTTNTVLRGAQLVILEGTTKDPGLPILNLPVPRIHPLFLNEAAIPAGN